MKEAVNTVNWNNPVSHSLLVFGTNSSQTQCGVFWKENDWGVESFAKFSN